jgi:hypothetical protein
MSGNFHAALILVGESPLGFCDFVLFLFSFEEGRPMPVKLGEDLLCLDTPSFFLDGSRLLPFSIKDKSLFPLDDLVLLRTFSLALFDTTAAEGKNSCSKVPSLEGSFSFFLVFFSLASK